ncbi:HlyD family efflux transporter periplasmic adaptor subunit [Desulfofalx alkaliphila]|uniref:HlyD family efflux transporter periplasmic adaptor subunit n=1 Tax=Desulfofalx alkaliphila TaxID=105483 RepID=UPI0012FF5725|nr:HlyD family efflux transporter periplasmic adaptor subunit [Desulfofalx alkaliphila]
MQPLSRLRKRKKRLFFGSCIIFLILAILVWTIVNVARPMVLNQLISINTISKDTVSITLPVEGLVAKEEAVIRSPINGELELVVEQGRRVAAHAVVAKVSALSLDTPGGSRVHNLAAPTAGAVCTNIDGLEEVLTPATLRELDLSGIGTIRKKVTAQPGGQTTMVERGQAVVKLVDNLRPVLIYLELKDEKIPPKLLEEGQGLNLMYQGQWFTSRIIKSQAKKENQSVLVEANSYPEELIFQRVAEFELLKTELTGLLVEEANLVYRDTQPGLYIVQRQKICWVPVEIKGVLQGKVAVESPALSGGVRYVANPHLVKEGDRVNK